MDLKLIARVSTWPSISGNTTCIAISRDLSPCLCSRHVSCVVEESTNCKTGMSPSIGSLKCVGEELRLGASTLLLANPKLLSTSLEFDCFKVWFTNASACGSLSEVTARAMGFIPWLTKLAIKPSNMRVLPFCKWLR